MNGIDYPLIYVVWNFILGIMPIFLCAGLFAMNRKREKINFFPSLIIFFIWLSFLPNAPYIISDMRHINGFCPDTSEDICPANAWMIFFFFLYSVWGWILYFFSLEQMMLFIKKYFDKSYLAFFPIIISPAVAIGLLLGLVDRLNTWDLFARPLYVARSAVYYLTVGEGIINLAVATLSLIALYYLGKLFFSPLDKVIVIQKIINKH